MNIKSMQHSIVLMLIVLTAVVSSQCPCIRDTDMNAEKCEKAVKCYESNEAQCNDVASKLFKKLLDATECKLSQICWFSFSFTWIAKAVEGKTNEELQSFDEEYVKTRMEQQYPCAKKQMDDGCKNKDEAEKCAKQIFPTEPECVTAFVEDCNGDNDGKSDKATAAGTFLLIAGIMAVISSSCSSVIGVVIFFIKKREKSDQQHPATSSSNQQTAE